MYTENPLTQTVTVTVTMFDNSFRLSLLALSLSAAFHYVTLPYFCSR